MTMYDLVIAEPKGEASNRGARVAVSLYVLGATIVFNGCRLKGLYTVTTEK